MTSHDRASRGFSLIELLVVIAIIGILAGLLFPMLSKVRESAYRTQCAANLRSIASANKQYADDENGSFISRRKPSSNTQFADDDAWFAGSLGTYLGLEPLGASRYVTMAQLSRAEVLACPTSVNSYPSASLDEDKIFSFGSSRAIFTMDSRDFIVDEDQLDVPSKTAMMGDSLQRPWTGEWYKQIFIPDIMSYPHARRSMNMAFFDGHVGGLGIDEVPDSETSTTPFADTPYVGLTFWRGELP